jgi:hypothetical protein
MTTCGENRLASGFKSVRNASVWAAPGGKMALRRGKMALCRCGCR